MIPRSIRKWLRAEKRKFLKTWRTRANFKGFTIKKTLSPVVLNIVKIPTQMTITKARRASVSISENLKVPMLTIASCRNHPTREATWLTMPGAPLVLRCTLGALGTLNLRLSVSSWNRRMQPTMIWVNNPPVESSSWKICLTKASTTKIVWLEQITPSSQAE